MPERELFQVEQLLSCNKKLTGNFFKAGIAGSKATVRVPYNYSNPREGPAFLQAVFSFKNSSDRSVFAVYMNRTGTSLHVHQVDARSDGQVFSKIHKVDKGFFLNLNSHLWSLDEGLLHLSTPENSNQLIIGRWMMQRVLSSKALENPNASSVRFYVARPDHAALLFGLSARPYSYVVAGSGDPTSFVISPDKARTIIMSLRNSNEILHPQTGQTIFMNFEMALPVPAEPVSIRTHHIIEYTDERTLENSVLIRKYAKAVSRLTRKSRLEKKA